jgi:hypothetical protein
VSPVGAGTIIMNLDGGLPHLESGLKIQLVARAGVEETLQDIRLLVRFSYAPTSAIRELARNCGASDSPVSLVLLGNR